MDKILIVGNIVFIPIESLDWDNKLETKYLKGSTSGGVTLSNIWSYSEIISKWPEAKPCKTLLEFNEVWKSS